MAVTRVATAVSTLGVVSSGAPGTINLNPTSAAQLLVVTVGWASAATYVPPSVTFGGERMVLQSTHSIDTAVGAVAVYTLPLFSPANVSTPITIQPSGFLGNTQISAQAYAGTSQSLGVMVTDEYGTSTGGVNTGTTGFTGITAGSVTSLVGMTFFGGTPGSIVTSGTGWARIGFASATNESVVTSENTSGSGALSCTLTDGGAAFWTMMVIGYEVLAGSPPATAGVVVEASTVACLGSISSAAPASTTFNPTAAADFIVATVGWASSDPLTPPIVTFDGALMHIVASPIMVDNGFGAVAIYTLELTSPVSTAKTVTVNSAPNFAGLTQIAVHSFSGSAKLLGKLFTDEYGTNSVPVGTGTTDMPGITLGSSLQFCTFTFFGTTPLSVTRSTGWAADGVATATNESVFAFHNYSKGGGDLPITLSNASVNFNFLCFGYEVLKVGATPPASTVTITSSQLFDLGAIGLAPATVSFDANGASVLIVASARTNNAATGPASYTYGGIPLHFLTTLQVRNTDTSTAMDIAVLANPPTGSQNIVAVGPAGYFGYTEAYVVGLSTTSGVLGVRATASVGGHGANLALDPSIAGSLLLAFTATIFPRANEVANYGWTELHNDTSGASITASIFTSVGSSTNNLILSSSDFGSLGVIVMEFEAALAVTPDRTGAGAAALEDPVPAGTAGNLGKLTPTGQEYHVYWESWLDIPNKAPAFVEPDDFYLAKIPAYVNWVMLSFAIPRCTYTGIGDNIKATVGLNYPGTVTQFIQTLALLRARNPTVKILLAVQQNTPEEAHNEPYDPNGWGGMTTDNVASTLAFVTDCGLDGVIIDYECISQSDAPDHHCYNDPGTGERQCYTDTELLATVKAMRAGLPRPLLLVLDLVHVGAYAVGDYTFAPPLGFNGGYDVCLSRDSAARACLDFLHVMTYDAGDTYDPRIAVRAVQALLPGIPAFIGLRVGPLQYQDVKQTALQIRDYCNTAIMLGLAGAHMYSGMWDVAYTGRNNPEFDPPFGNYNAAFPDGNIAGAIAAEVFNLGTQNVPAGKGYTGKQANLRMNNTPLLKGVTGPRL